MVSGIGILIGFSLLTFGVWKRMNLIIMAILSAGVIAIFSGEPLMGTLSGPFIQGFSSFAAPFLLLFVIGSLFGKLMDDSGATWRIGTSIVRKAGDRWALAAYIAVASLLLYGGVSVFVVVFVLLPVARSIFKLGKIPWFLFPLITCYSLVFPLAMLPGGLQVHNVIPTAYLGTDLMAGSVVGLVAAAIYIVFGGLYISWELKKSRDKIGLPESIPPSTVKELDEDKIEKTAPNLLLSIIPIVTALTLINIVKMDVVSGLTIASLACIILFYKSFDNLLDTVNLGATNGVMPLILVAVVVGVAKTVAITPAFEMFKVWLMALPVSGLFKIFVITNSISAITGSASGSMTMTLEMFGSDFLSMNLNPGTIHRLMTVSSVALDTLPWNSFIVLLFTLSGVSYSKGYKQVFVISVVLPLLAALSIVLIG